MPSLEAQMPWCWDPPTLLLRTSLLSVPPHSLGDPLVLLLHPLPPRRLPVAALMLAM